MPTLSGVSASFGNKAGRLEGGFVGDDAYICATGTQSFWLRVSSYTSWNLYAQFGGASRVCYWQHDPNTGFKWRSNPYWHQVNTDSPPLYNWCLCVIRHLNGSNDALFTVDDGSADTIIFPYEALTSIILGGGYTGGYGVHGAIAHYAEWAGTDIGTEGVTALLAGTNPQDIGGLTRYFQDMSVADEQTTISPTVGSGDLTVVGTVGTYGSDPPVYAATGGGNNAALLYYYQQLLKRRRG